MFITLKMEINKRKHKDRIKVTKLTERDKHEEDHGFELRPKLQIGIEKSTA